MNICLNIPFPSKELAFIVYEVLSVDKDLKRSEVHRSINTDGASIVINFQGKELKKLRVAVNSSIKNIKLILKTANQFSSS